MNLHLLPDNGFMNFFIQLNEQCGGENDRYIVCANIPPFKKAVKTKILSDKAVAAEYNSTEFKKTAGDLSQYQKIIIHFLDDRACDFIIQSPDDITFSWAFWGADFYSPFRYFTHDIYDDLSARYFAENGTYSATGNKITDWLKQLNEKTFKPITDKIRYEKKRKAIKKIKYLLHYNPLDHQLVEKQFNATLTLVPYFYFEFDYIQLPLLNKQERDEIKKSIGLNSETLIMLGNSASLSNNHLQALEYLKQLPAKNFSILCPLSYGDAKYAQHVIKTGKKYFGENFTGLTTYMDKEKYSKILQAADACVMNHIRTEGVGNSLMMLAMGKKVFLNEKSNFCKFLQERKVVVNYVSQLNADSFHPLDAATAAENRRIACNFFSMENARKNVTAINQYPQ